MDKKEKKQVINKVIDKIIDNQRINLEDAGIDTTDIDWYDMVLIKVLPGSCVPEKGDVKGKQTSIILGNKEAAIFPVIKRQEYDGKTVGRHITMKLPIKIMSNNIKYLNEEDILSDNRVLESYITTNETTGGRIELGTKTIDGEEYKRFYGALYKECILIVIKIKDKLEYILLAIKPEDADIYFDEFDKKNITYFDNKAKINKAEQVIFVSTNNIEDRKIEELFHNRLIYGAPGTGKSNLLKKESLVFGENYERVTFYEDYSYSQFVGSYKPYSDKNGKVGYKFVAGPFLRQLGKALNPNNNGQPYLIIIEEINRANASYVFGDMFQLLDRDSNGVGEYEVHVSDEVKQYLKDEHQINKDSLKLPANFYIWATMNCADQGVFPLDSAFKRRFDEYKLMDINDNEYKIANIDILVGCNGIGTINWNLFRRTINKYLLSKDIKDDKLIGPFFIKPSVLEDAKKAQSAIRDKLLMYLLEDVVKRKKGLFIDNVKSLSKINELYGKNNGDNIIFADDFMNMLYEELGNHKKNKSNTAE